MQSTGSERRGDRTKMNEDTGIIDGKQQMAAGGKAMQIPGRRKRKTRVESGTEVFGEGKCLFYLSSHFILMSHVLVMHKSKCSLKQHRWPDPGPGCSLSGDKTGSKAALTY